MMMNGSKKDGWWMLLFELWIGLVVVVWEEDGRLIETRSGGMAVGYYLGIHRESEF